MESAISVQPDNYRNAIYVGNIKQTKGDLIEAEAEYSKLLQTQSVRGQINGRYWLAHLYLLQGKFGRCGQELAAGIEHARDTGQIKLESDLLLAQAFYLLQLKKFEEAIEAAEAAFRTAEEANSKDNRKHALHCEALAYVQLGKYAEVDETGDRLRAFIEQTDTPSHLRHYKHIQAVRARHEGRNAEAIALLEDAIALLPAQKYNNDKHAMYYEALAFLYYESGDVDKALSQYEAVTRLTTGRLTTGDQYTKSLYMLGKIHQEQGRDSEALDYYQKYLNLWENADPGIEEIDQARTQIRNLKDTGK
jgi:tetratricopeptide (TPR) repeat protein